MAGVHQLKKLAQSRTNTNRKWVDYMPKHWSSYTLIFSVASLLIFFFCFYDFNSSPTSLLRSASREIGVLRAQVTDASSIFSLPRTSPTADVNATTSSDRGQEKDAEFEKRVEGSVLVKNVSSTETQRDSSKSSVETPQIASASRSGREQSPRVGRSHVVESPADHERLEGPVHVDSKTLKEMDAVSEEGSRLTGLEDRAQRAGQRAASAAIANQAADAEAAAVRFETCDFSKGRWVMDEDYPIYKPFECPFMDGGFRCVENGRPSDFQKWRWQPDGCDLPRFNAKDMLERMRGSRMAFVGDSLGRNQWESMLCMLAEGVANKSRIYEINGESIDKHTGFLIFRFEDYDFTVEYYRSPFLVPQGRPAKGADPKVRTTLKLTEIDWSASKWRGADIIILNSGHWWSWGKTLRSGNYFQVGNEIPMDMEVGDAFGKAMQTVAEYVDNQVDPHKSQVLFRSYSPVHFKGGAWYNGGACHAENHPITNLTGPYEDRSGNRMLVDIFSKNKRTPITFVNITYLSELRPDGHSSIYGSVPHSPVHRQDCSHWCLPGAPDTWSELVLAQLLQNGKGKWAKKAKS